MARAWWHGTAQELLKNEVGAVRDALTQQLSFPLEPAQRDAWASTIWHLRTVAEAIPDAHFFLEFAIPRMGRRADAVIVAGGIVFVVEYKVGANDFALSARQQAHGYALDLKSFHETSHDVPIVPVLVATKAKPVDVGLGLWAGDDVHPPVCANEGSLIAVISQFVAANAFPAIDPMAWAAGAYRPTPTIVEAAQALYRGHDVKEISRSGADGENLTATTSLIEHVVAEARADGTKAICFVTGVPGAGKTLVGLNLASRHLDAAAGADATYLSGNGPLVKVLRKALLADWQDRTPLKERRTKGTKAREESRVEKMIQNVHRFRDEALRENGPPNEQVVIFDEAQRAWTREQTSEFMRRKRNQPDFDQSEPAFLLSVMDRRHDWCVVVCLVGEGQEINKGEAGISEWLDALAADFRHWKAFLPPRLLSEEFGISKELAYRAARLAPTTSPSLHLSHSMRSFKAKGVASLIGQILEGSPESARALISSLGDFPLFRTRSLKDARAWLKKRQRGPQRAGLLASSNALRLKPEGLFVKADIDECNWFLNDQDDIRSSTMLEDVATEFQVQGLELDWCCVCWDLDLTRSKSGWVARSFAGTRWQPKSPTGLVGMRRQYAINAYRVLLTRARQGMVIFVPPGDAEDPTRPPAAYDAVDSWLAECGIPEL